MSSTPSFSPAGRLTLVLAICAASGACFRPIFPGSERIFEQEWTLTPRTIGESAMDTVSLRMARKPVHGKEAPATVVAFDGTRCTVTERRFAEVKEGEKVWCAWRKS